MGKREVGQLTPFDLIVILIISNAVQNAIIGEDNSLSGGVVSVLTILALNFLFVEIAYRSKRIRRLLEGEPTLLVHNGHILEKNLQRERITRDELFATLRKNGITDPNKVRIAILEDTGQISVIAFN